MKVIFSMLRNLRLIPVTFLLSACSFNAGENHVYLPCESPANYYMENEFIKDQGFNNLEVGSGLREFNPDETLEKFSTPCLVEWSSKGDPLSDYLIASRLIGSSNVIFMDDNVESFSYDTVKSLSVAASPRVCPNYDGSEDVFRCSSGLPEAKYLLGRYLRSVDPGDPKSKNLLSSAASDRLSIAGQWIY